jgi:hypothetical protein
VDIGQHRAADARLHLGQDVEPRVHADAALARKTGPVGLVVAGLEDIGGTRSLAQASAMRDAIISAWSSDSSWQGPAITVSGLVIADRDRTDDDLFHGACPPISLVPRQELTCSRRIDTVIEIRR